MLDANVCEEIVMAAITQTPFEEELEIFRTEEEVAQQYFFAYLSVRNLAAKNQDVLKAMNQTPLFWIAASLATIDGGCSAVPARLGLMSAPGQLRRR
jgi:hypothetical protein